MPRIKAAKLRMHAKELHELARKISLNVDRAKLLKHAEALEREAYILAGDDPPPTQALSLLEC